MTTYRPEEWVILRFVGELPYPDRVLGGWRGGFIDPDSWRLNSGISEIRDLGDTYEFDGYSGSVYVCHKMNEGRTVWLSSVIAQLETALEPVRLAVIPATTVEGFAL